jgi:hypothetical protein
MRNQMSPFRVPAGATPGEPARRLEVTGGRDAGRGVRLLDVAGLTLPALRADAAIA